MAQKRQVEARKMDEQDDWRKLISHPELVNTTGIGGTSFYDAKGFRFHIPAYMCLTILEADQHYSAVESFFFSLTNLGDYQSERFDILNTAQKAAVTSFLEYILENESERFVYEVQDIEIAKNNYFDAN